MAQVILKNISKRYDKTVWAVRNANLEIADREFMVIVGPSGCGKTTTLRMIAGLEDVTEGTITIANRVVNNVPPKDRDIAMVFQNYALYPHMTVYQNMAFSLKLRKFQKAEIHKRITETAQMLDIQDLLTRKPKALSGGQRQRVALGRAVVRNPAAFLFDEPLSNLDAKLRMTMRAELKSLHRRLQTTSIYVTHDQSEAMTLGDRICVMHHGVIQQVAPPMQVYDQPVNRFVAGFLGMPPMNFFDGTIDVKSDQFSFVMARGTSLPLCHSMGKLSSYAGRKMVLGIRPEFLSLEKLPDTKENSITATVTLIEPLGARIDVHLTSNAGKNVIANMDPHADIAVGQTVELFFDPEKAMVFEPGELGKNIAL